MSESSPASPLPTDRGALLSKLEAAPAFDLIIIGGGASGLGVALDARLRGLSVLLLESHDFAGGTSSRATKLVHGGVRYLAQGNLSLVREALHERKALLHNAPHLAHALGFIMPAYRRWEIPFYGLGLKLYDALAGAASLGNTQWLSKAETVRQLSGVKTAHLHGGVKYWDGQFDDARLALALARTAAAQGALLLNYCPVVGLLHENGRVAGVRWRDGLAQGTGREGTVRARCVINATGVWVDEIRQMDGAQRGGGAKPMVEPSQGVHLVVSREFLPARDALLVPRTRDGRVLFAVPWMGHVILGTTDTPRTAPAREPRALPEEVAFILGEAGKVLARAPGPRDVLSTWVGLRPLVRPPKEEEGNTKSISREHTVLVSRSGLVTVTGGKWTTYRAMAEDVLRQCQQASVLGPLPPCRTADFPLVGAPAEAAGDQSDLSALPDLRRYGTEAGAVCDLPGQDESLGLGLTTAMVRFAVRYEYVRTVEDMLARRHRMLFLNAACAKRAARRVSEILREEIGGDGDLAAFMALADQYADVPGRDGAPSADS